jgi:hypothetical protein
MVKLFEEEIHIMQLFYANQSIRNVPDISNATHDRSIFNIKYFKISGVRYSWLHSNSQCIDLCFVKLNIGNKHGLCSELKKCPRIKSKYIFLKSRFSSGNDSVKLELLCAKVFLKLHTCCLD